MQTSPVIMPWTAPMTEGLVNTNMSRQSHMSRLVAVQRCVFKMAIEASMLAEYGAPPLNPVQPIQSNPAPARVNKMLLGGNLSLSLPILGPT